MKYASLTIFLNLFLISPSLGWRPYVIEFMNASAQSLSDSIAMNASFSPTGSISMYTNFLQSLPTLSAKVLFTMESWNGIYDMELVNRTIDLCQLLKNPRYEPIVQVFYKAISKKAVVPRSCPFEKKMYYFKDAEIDTEGFPPAMPQKKCKVDLILLTKTGMKWKPIGRYFFNFQIKSTS